MIYYVVNLLIFFVELYSKKNKPVSIINYLAPTLYYYYRVTYNYVIQIQG